MRAIINNKIDYRNNKGIENILERHEPRIENINVLVATTHDETEYNIVVVFSIKENDSVQDVEINLRRLR